MDGGRLLPPEDETGPDEAERTESKRYHRLLFTFYLAAQLLGFGGVALALHYGQGWVSVTAVLVLFPLAHAGGLVKRDDRALIIEQLRLFLAALFAALTASSLLWLALSVFDADVTKSARLIGATGVGSATGLGDGSTAGLRVNEEPGFLHDELLVTLAVTDDGGGAASCLTPGELSFQGGDLAGNVPDVALDDEVSVALPLEEAGPSVSVDIQVNTDRGCRLTLRLEEADYR